MNIKSYLEWRFRVNNHPKYLRYCNEWINNLTSTQIEYFEREAEHLIERGVYSG